MSQPSSDSEDSLTTSSSSSSKPRRKKKRSNQSGNESEQKGKKSKYEIRRDHNQMKYRRCRLTWESEKDGPDYANEKENLRIMTRDVKTGEQIELVLINRELAKHIEYIDKFSLRLDKIGHIVIAGKTKDGKEILLNRLIVEAAIRNLSEEDRKLAQAKGLNVKLVPEHRRPNLGNITKNNVGLLVTGEANSKFKSGKRGKPKTSEYPGVSFINDERYKSKWRVKIREIGEFKLVQRQFKTERIAARFALDHYDKVYADDQVNRSVIHLYRDGRFAPYLKTYDRMSDLFRAARPSIDWNV